MVVDVEGTVVLVTLVVVLRLVEVDTVLLVVVAMVDVILVVVGVMSVEVDETEVEVVVLDVEVVDTIVTEVVVVEVVVVPAAGSRSKAPMSQIAPSTRSPSSGRVAKNYKKSLTLALIPGADALTIACLSRTPRPWSATFDFEKNLAKRLSCPILRRAMSTIANGNRTTAQANKLAPTFEWLDGSC